MKQLIMLMTGLMMVCLSACSSDDDPQPIPEAPRSMITEFVWPTSIFHEESAFNVLFEKDDKTSKIVDFKILDFDINAVGKSIDFSTDPGLFVQQLNEIGDTCAPADLPAEAWNYRPLIRPIRSMSIKVDDRDVTQQFEIAYVSYYHFIKNGYSWNGITNRGPVYKMTLDEFNTSGDKMLVDANGIKLYMPEEFKTIVTYSHYINRLFTIRIEYSDGSSDSFDCRPVSMLTWERLKTIVRTYNDGKVQDFPDWNTLKSPKK